MAKSNKQEVATVQNSASSRFSAMVFKELGATVGQPIEATERQKKLAQNYFVKLDMILKENAIKKPNDGFAWENVNMNKLAMDVVAFTSIGLDPMQPNHINIIPYKNGKTGKFDITFIQGYEGLRLKAIKYGLDVPDSFVTELVYSNDNFIPRKKGFDNEVENYAFEITNPFDRGEVIGGFYYHAFSKNPAKNRLVIMSVKDIEKRKPKYASPEFWGGEKDKWEGGKKVGKETIEGWYDEMCLKTIKRACYSDITIDGQKIDDAYYKAMEASDNRVENQVQEEFENNANKEELKFEEAEEVPTEEAFSDPAQLSIMDTETEETK